MWGVEGVGVLFFISVIAPTKLNLEGNRLDQSQGQIQLVVPWSVMAVHQDWPGALGGFQPSGQQLYISVRFLPVSAVAALFSEILWSTVGMKPHC